jgi:hypothetical protein
MTKPSHFMFGLLVAFGATAALLGSRIVPETGRLPFESEAEAARKEARYAQRQRASGRMLDPGRGEFVAPRQDVLAGGPTQPAGVASTSGANPESGEQPSATSGPTEANVAPGWRLHGTVRLEDGSKNAAQIPWAVAIQLDPVGSGAHSSEGPARVDCAEDGSYSLEGLLPGLYRLRATPRIASNMASSEDSAPEALPVAMDIDLPRLNVGSPKQAKQLQKNWPQDLVLPQPRRLFGRIFRSNEPRPGVRVAVHEMGMKRGQAVSDENGRFEIAGVGTGPWRFELEDAEGQELTVDKVNASDDFDKRRIEASVVVLP